MALKYQSELFPAGRMMEQRLGRELFDSIPREPGIYRFYGRFDELLYVGKAVDLHRRLASYRRAQAGRVPRKVGELVRRVHRIETEVHASDDEALLAENRWIRRERPPYNHANKHTETYYYIILDREDDVLKVHLSMSLLPEDNGLYRYGCFKGHIRVRHMLGSLLQLFWLACNRATSPHRLPVQLTRRITPLNYSLRFAQPDAVPCDPDQDEALILLQAWFEGRSEALLQRLTEWNSHFTASSSFNRLFTAAAMDRLSSFYHNVLLPHRQMRETWLDGHPLIGRDKLDDLLVMLAASARLGKRERRSPKESKPDPA